MRSCAALRRRARDEQGHGAVRRRGDIRHRSRGACTASAAMRSWGGCRRTGCNGRLQWAWPRRLVRRATAAWCACPMGPSRSRAARSRTPRRRCVRRARVARPRAVVWYVARRGTADGWRARCGARMLRRVVYGVRRMEPEWSVCVLVCNRWRGGDPIGTRSAAQQSARGVRCTMRVRSSYTAWRGFPTERCMPSEAYFVPTRSGPVLPRCMRYRMRRCGMQCSRCTRLRCMLHWVCVASEQYIALYVASTCRIDACCIGALARVACCIGARWRVSSVRVTRCIGARCMLHRRALHRRALHRGIASACAASAPVASACVASAPRSRPAAPLPCDAL
jgi:hypothetical protein